MNDERLGNPSLGNFHLRNNNPNFKHIPSKVEIEQQSVYEVNPPNAKDSELIVDFELITQPIRQTDLVSSDVLVFVTNFNLIYKRELDSKESQEVIFSNQQTKSLVQDHYIFMLFYFKMCDKLFTVSQIRPDALHQENVQQES